MDAIDTSFAPGALREIAVTAAREAGRLQQEAARTRFAIEQKGPADITTAVDLACEARIVEVIRAACPDHDLLAEEGTATGGASPYLWIADPLDGTKNYAHGYARSCVSIALLIRGVAALGVVFNARQGELFVAEAGKGATLNGERISVSGVRELGRAMVASALTYDGRGADRAQLDRLGRVLGAVEAVRSDGCAALDLCDVACGRFEAYFERGLKPWDSAAAALIVQEAGGRVSAFKGAAHDIYAAETFASNGQIHEALAALL